MASRRPERSSRNPRTEPTTEGDSCSASEPNARFASQLVEELERSGVTDACISPGSRSTPLVLAFARSTRIRSWMITDERSASFFALGMARESGRPVVLLSTSGTAAANYLPAVAEASLSGIPLILLTADRPPELRDCSAPQTIDQVRLFGAHVRWSVDVPSPAAGLDLEDYYRTLACRAVAAALEPPPGPVHLNLPMREPLFDMDEEKQVIAPRADGSSPDSKPPYVAIHFASGGPSPETLRAITEKIGGCERGLIVCGPGAGSRGAAAAITNLAKRLSWPILADPLSELRFGGHDRSQVVDAYDLLLREPEFSRSHRPEAILQLGAPPTSKALQVFLAEERARCHVLVAPPRIWPDPLHRVTDVVRAATGPFCEALGSGLENAQTSSDWLYSWCSASAVVRSAVAELARSGSEIFEGAVFPELQRLLPPGAALHVGNSMPIRDADMFLASSAVDLRVFGNRGASGIDGVLSAALGAAALRKSPTALVLGDLSFLHDIGALQIAARHRIDLLVVVIHNDGGGIFSFLPQSALGEETFETFFATPHGLNLDPAVSMCGGRHTRVGSWSELSAAIENALRGSGLHVVEIRSHRPRNHERHREILDAALARLRAAMKRGEIE